MKRRMPMSSKPIRGFATISMGCCGATSTNSTTNCNRCVVASDQLLTRIMENWGKGQHWMEMVLTPGQREIFNELQALMSLVEGYSNHIMNAIGKEILPNFEEIEHRIEQRKGSRPVGRDSSSTASQAWT